MEPVAYSWPSCRPVASQASDNVAADNDNADDEQLTHQQLQAWVHSLVYSDGKLCIPSDSLQLLPARMPYELLGPCILAAVDACAAAAAAVQQDNTPTAPAEGAPSAELDPQQQLQQQQQFGLHLYGIDLQEPVTGPLSTCLQAYPALQQLVLQELNVDTHAAAALAQHVCRSPQHAAAAANSSLKQLHLRGVFMGQLAWQALVKGMGQASCQLQTLRLHSCLSISSVQLLAAAVTTGCSSLQELDLSCNTLGAAPSTSSNGSSEGAHLQHAASNQADGAWSCLIDALAQPCCQQLQALVLSQCDLGPTAASALSRLLGARSRSNMQRLELAHCPGMGEAVLQQLAAAAGSHPSLRLLDLSGTALTDPCLKALTQGQGSSWRWHASTCLQLQELRLASNSSLSGAAVAQHLAKLHAAGSSLRALHTLDLSNCPGVGDTSAAALAACLSSSHCGLKALKLCGCEVTDEGASALAAAVTGDSGSAGRKPAQHAPSLQELRLADNQITAAGMQCFAAAVQHPGCCLRLLDVSLNWAGPEAVRPIWEAASAAPQPLTILRECSHDLWRVEAAKAAARAAAAADAAAAAAAEAAAAAAAAGSSWDPQQGCDQLSVQQHPAAATAQGFANSSYHGGSVITGGGGGSSMRTFAGSPVRPAGAVSPEGTVDGGACTATGPSTAVWLYNGLYRRSDCEAGEAWSPDSPPEPPAGGLGPSSLEAAVPGAAAPTTDTAGLVSTRLSFVDAGGDLAAGQHGSGVQCGRQLPGGSSGSSVGRSSLGGSEADSSSGSLRTVDPGLLEGNDSSSGSVCAGAGSMGLPAVAQGLAGGCSAVSPVGAAPLLQVDHDTGEAPWSASQLPAEAAAEVAARDAASPAADPVVGSVAAAEGGMTSCDGVQLSSPDSSSSSSTADGCIQQEVSFRYQIERSSDDVVHSPTRYDQKPQQQEEQRQQRQQQQQQLKGLLGSQEFTLSPPNPLFFSNSPLASPVAPRRPQLGALDAAPPSILLSLQPHPAAAAAAAGDRPSSSAASPATAGTFTAGPGSDSQQLAAAAAGAAKLGPQGEVPRLQAAPAGHMHAGSPAGAELERAAVVGVRRSSLVGGSGVRAALQLRQPFSPDRQLAAPSIRAMPPGSPRRRCGLNSPAPLGTVAIAVPVDCGAASCATATWQLDAAALPRPPLQSVGLRAQHAKSGQGAGTKDAASPARPACSEASCGSVGSSRSPAAANSSPSKLARQRVSQQDARTPQHQQLAGVVGSMGWAAAGDVPSTTSSLLLQSAPGGVRSGDAAAGKPAGQPLIQRKLDLQQQQQQQQCVRQLFGEQPGALCCEVKAVASSGSLWGSLVGGADMDEELGLGLSWGHEASKHVLALPLVSG